MDCAGIDVRRILKGTKVGWIRQFGQGASENGIFSVVPLEPVDVLEAHLFVGRHRAPIDERDERRGKLVITCHEVRHMFIDGRKNALAALIAVYTNRPADK